MPYMDPRNTTQQALRNLGYAGEFGSFAGLQNELTAKGVKEPQWNGRQWVA